MKKYLPIPKSLLLLALILLHLAASAQNIRVTGSIRDEKGPLTGASITSQSDPAVGTTTDENGKYSISVPGNTVLVFSLIGYKTIEMPVDGRTTINLTLINENVNLNEVVVTALGIGRRTKSLVYATQNVKTSTLTELRDPNNIINTFQGKIANALINQSSSGVGSDARIILRGNRSIQGNNSALIVVDGVPSTTPSNINPDDIESVTVLRGASAGALYGSQAGNGVIVITTKRGRADRFTVNVNNSVAFEMPFALPRVQNVYGQGSAGVFDPASGQSWGAKMDDRKYTNYQGQERTYSPEPDNISDFFRTGFSRSNAITFSGGSEKMQGLLSYANNDVQGIMPLNDLMSHNVNLRLTNHLGKRFTTDAKITYFNQQISHRPRYGEGNTAVFDIYQIPRNISIEDAKVYEKVNSLGVAVPAPWVSPLPAIYGNPYWAINNDVFNEDRNQVVGFLSAKYQLTNWLSVTGRANMDRVFRTQEQKTNQGTVSWAKNPGGLYTVIKNELTQKWFDVILDGNNKIGEDFKVDYHIGAIYQDNQFDQINSIADGLNVANKFSLNFATRPAFATSGTRVQTQSVFGQMNFSFKELIYIDASLRNDWDSRLPAPHSFQYYSAGVSSILSDIITMPKAVSFLKASVNYAEVGNGGQFGLLATTYSYRTGAGNGYLARGTVVPMPGLKPEIVKNLETGLEAKFFKNRLGLAFTYYKSNSINQLLSISLPAPTGFISQYINAGNIQNKGVEVVLSGTPVQQKNLVWDVDFNFAMNRNKVIELSDNLKVVYLGGWLDYGARPQIQVGGSYGDIVGYQWQRDEKGNFMVNAAGRPLTAMAAGKPAGYLGNFNPKATLGLSNSVTFRGVSLRVLVDGRVGGIMVSGTEQNLSFSGITEGTLKYREGGWNLGGVDASGQAVNKTITAQEFWQTVSGKRNGNGEFYAYDATNFRVREISLGYNIPFKANLFIKGARVSAVARNVLWLYRGSSILNIPGLEKRKMWFDPDMSMGTNNTFQGVEYGALPSTRSMGLNLNLTF